MVYLGIIVFTLSFSIILVLYLYRFIIIISIVKQGFFYMKIVFAFFFICLFIEKLSLPPNFYVFIKYQGIQRQPKGTQSNKQLGTITCYFVRYLVRIYRTQSNYFKQSNIHYTK